MEKKLLEEKSNKFIETKQINNILNRALLYLDSGFPVHFSGNSGSGKTTLAIELAKRLDNNYVLLYGNEDFDSIDLLGNNIGFETNTTVDNFIHSVHKTKEETKRIWTDDRIAIACKYGYTLLYDEFTRTPPESNNILLSVLEEKVLQLPPIRNGSNHLQVDPKFKAIFTSNPQEYAGVHPSQDALLDRMITINLNNYDSSTVKKIIMETTGLSLTNTNKILSFINDVRKNNNLTNLSSLRTGIKFAKIIKYNKSNLFKNPEIFAKICVDILSYEVNTDENIYNYVTNYIRSEF
jgi:gas vesicle protein GvpN